jgi:hypothetical protein
MEHDDVADHVLQLADIAGPAIGQQNGFHFWHEGAEAAALGLGKVTQEMLSQQQDIGTPLTQRRHCNGQDVEPVEQVLAE